MRPDIELAKKYGLDDKQIEAMSGMRTMLPRGSIWRMIKHSPEEIRELMEAYAELFVEKTRDFVEALNLAKESPELLREANRQLAQLTRNSISKDESIKRRLREMNPETTQNLTPQSEHSDSSI